MASKQFSVIDLVSLLFLPAGIGLFCQVLIAQTLAEQLLTLALLLFCLELARMAAVDLKNIQTIEKQQANEGRQETEDSRLHRFRITVVSTIVLEITGFYAALISLPWGASLIIFSQLWFNLFAGVQLWPKGTPSITDFGISQRWAVLIANTLGLGLLCLWPILTVRLWLASGLLILITLFFAIKYLVPGSQPSPEK